MPTQANRPLPDGYQLQNYRIRKVLACGGFSIVYLAEDENEVPVAIKEYLRASLALRNLGDALPAIAAENLATFRYGMACSRCRRCCSANAIRSVSLTSRTAEFHAKVLMLANWRAGN